MKDSSILPAWQKLQDLAESHKNLDSNDLSNSVEHQVAVAGMQLNFARQHLDGAVISAFEELCDELNMANQIKALCTGEIVNHSEQRPALHVMARENLVQASDCAYDFQWRKMQEYATSLAAGKFKNIIHIGIGGSDLGPRLLADALQSYMHNKFKLHFAASNDIQELNEILAQCAAQDTLVILVSKSFTTAETLSNGAIAKEWLKANLDSGEVGQHLFAVTANKALAEEFGVASSNVLSMPDGIGGRFSIWSPVSLSVAAAIGWDNYVALVQGAHAMDQHFQTADALQNMPVLLALLAVWNYNFLEYPTQAMLAYDARLGLLVPYMQQLYMESLGKSVTPSGEQLSYVSGSILWGGRGPDSQHSFHQLLQQGTHQVALDFVVPLQADNISTAERKPVWANALAQAQVMWQGHEDEHTYKIIAGGQPSNMLLLPQLDPHYLGMLIAL